MKKTMLKLVLFAIVIFMAFACKKDKYSEIGDPPNRLNAISHTWKLEKVNLIDEAGLVTKDSVNLSDFYVVGENATTLSFTKDLTYSLVLGPGKNFLGNGGTWVFDEPDFPTKIIVKSGSQSLEFLLNTMPRETDNYLRFKINRNCDNNVISSYNYTFKRID